MLQIRWVNGVSEALPLTRPRIRVGRHADNDLIIDDPTISGSHMEITYSQGRIYVTDLGSRNGTFLDGQPLPQGQTIAVQFGAIIRLHTMIELLVEPPDPYTPPLVAPEHVLVRARPGPGLIIQQRDGPLQMIPLGTQPLKLGRAPDNDIIIPSPVVSGHHAEITVHDDGHYTITDLDSRNGLFYEGQRIKSKPLHPGNVLNITDQVTIRYAAAMGLISVGSGSGQAKTTEPRLLDLAARKAVRIGRAPDNDLRVDDPRASRYHAVIERVGMRYRIRDLRSHNGTFVNGQRVEKELFIAEGDVLQIAGTKLNFVEDGLEQVDMRGGLRVDLVGLRKEVGGGKNLLQDISLSIYPREFVALVGTSGAGKSTLLDAMNGFRPATQGQVLVNGASLYRNYDAYRTELGYVPQDDIMHRELSVYEALDFAARLRMPADTSAEERQARIGQVLRDLDLEQRKNLPIQKLSGGQRKRVSIGIELLTRPRLFFLDEATSGLDPGTELELMHLLRHLTEDPNEGRTIVLVTHATKNVMLCDQVIFLTKGGYLAFFGPPDEALRYFDQYRNQQDKRLKPDFEFDDIYTLIDPDKALPDNATEKEKLALAAEWARRYRQSPYYQKYVAGRARELRQAPQRAHAQKAGSADRRRPRTSPIHQFSILSSRSLAVLRRDPKSLAVLLLQAPLIGIMSLINLNKDIFTPSKGNQGDALQTLFLAVIIVLLFGTVNAAREFTKEAPVYKRERMVNLQVMPYVFSKVLVAGMFCLYQVAVYLFFTYFTTDWPNKLMGIGGWGQLYLTLTLASLSGIMLGLLLSALSSNDGQAVALIPVILIPQFIFAGVMMPNLAKTPVIPQIATSKWAVAALANITYVEDLPLQPSSSGDIKKQRDEAVEAIKQQKIQKEVDKIVAERLPAEVEKALADEVRKATDQAIQAQTEAAQNKAEAEARKQMEGQLIMTQAQKEQQVAQARQQAAAQVAANRPKIEAATRDKLRPSVEAAVRIELTRRVRNEVNANLPADATNGLFEAEGQWKHVFGTRTATDWAAMTVIMVALLGIILVLIKRKDVV
jgi:ABC-type multidrug transport system ATPase subunit/pSer/pThr/pTyr-binding forkhead associated (FHA) protein